MAEITPPLIRGEIASRGWKAKFVKRTGKEFNIRFWQADESHLLGYRLTTGTDHLELDGNSISWYIAGGMKKKRFRVGSHPNNFEIRFNTHSVLRFVGNIEFLIDDRMVLSSD
jgi:hypothetical protein